MPSIDDSDSPSPPFAWIETIAGEERVAIVLRLICRGLDRASIHAFARENGWHEEPLDVDHYIETGISELRKSAGDIDTEVELGKAHQRLDDLYMQAMKGKDVKTALHIQKEINKILALKVAASKVATPGQPTPAERPRLEIVGATRPRKVAGKNPK